jgi:2-dehydropantoate 2-reductase
MNIAVIGPGALGIVYASRFARAGASVTLVDHKPDRIKRLNGKSFQVENSAGTNEIWIPVDGAVPAAAELIVVCVKAHATDSLTLPQNVPVLSIQNGLNNVETIASYVGSGKVLAGVTTEAATQLDEGHVRHVADGVTTIGAWTECDTSPAERVLTNAGFRCEVTDAPGQMIWEKTAINAGINPLTAVLNVPNGRLLAVRETRELLRDLVVEATKVAAIEGYRFSRSLVEAAEETCEQTAENISSMLQDVRAGRQTEIDAISGEVLRRAQTTALSVPRTRTMYQLVRGIESR